MNHTDIKKEFIEFLDEREEFFKPVHDNWYRTRCPYCGDTQKNLREGHFYIWIDVLNNYSMGFNCFRCGERGTITEETIDLMGGDSLLKQHINILNNESKKRHRREIIAEEKLMHFDYKLPEPKRGKKTQYIEDRLGIALEEEDLKDFKIITSLRDFLALNNVKTYPFSDQTMYALEDHYVGFLSNGNSHIIFRDITETEHLLSIKYPITQECMQNKIFYSITTDTDLFTEENIVINLSEGVLDAIGIAKHFDQKKYNIMNIAATGRNYNIMINRLIGLGLVGNNIIINIYSDNDEEFGNKKNSYASSFPYYKKILEKYKILFKEINVIYNKKAKDFGYPKEKIAIAKRRL